MELHKVEGQEKLQESFGGFVKVYEKVAMHQVSSEASKEARLARKEDHDAQLHKLQALTAQLDTYSKMATSTNMTVSEKGAKLVQKVSAAIEELMNQM